MTGERLKDLRKRLGKTQAELGTVFGVSRQTIWQWECGSRSVPRAVALAMPWLVVKHEMAKEETD
jgi:transcriptional regulator with XRE-family HTH domain